MYFMNKLAAFALVTLAATALAACGRSEDANLTATADTVEIPADAAMVEATALPVEGATGVATDPATDAVDTASATAD
jgi:hypothetical protein